MYTGAVVGLLAKIVDSVTNLQMTNWWRFSEDFGTLLGHIHVICFTKDIVPEKGYTFNNQLYAKTVSNIMFCDDSLVVGNGFRGK